MSKYNLEGTQTPCEVLFRQAVYKGSVVNGDGFQGYYVRVEYDEGLYEIDWHYNCGSGEDNHPSSPDIVFSENDLIIVEFNKEGVPLKAIGHADGAKNCLGKYWIAEERNNNLYVDADGSSAILVFYDEGTGDELETPRNYRKCSEDAAKIMHDLWDEAVSYRGIDSVRFAENYPFKIGVLIEIRALPWSALSDPNVDDYIYTHLYIEYSISQTTKEITISDYTPILDPSIYTSPVALLSSYDEIMAVRNENGEVGNPHGTGCRGVGFTAHCDEKDICSFSKTCDLSSSYGPDEYGNNWINDETKYSQKRMEHSYPNEPTCYWNQPMVYKNAGMHVSQYAETKITVGGTFSKIISMNAQKENELQYTHDKHKVGDQYIWGRGPWCAENKTAGRWWSPLDFHIERTRISENSYYYDVPEYGLPTVTQDIYYYCKGKFYGRGYGVSQVECVGYDYVWPWTCDCHDNCADPNDDTCEYGGKDCNPDLTDTSTQSETVMGPYNEYDDGSFSITVFQTPVSTMESSDEVFSEPLHQKIRDVDLEYWGYHVDYNPIWSDQCVDLYGSIVDPCKLSEPASPSFPQQWYNCAEQIIPNQMFPGWIYYMPSNVYVMRGWPVYTLGDGKVFCKQRIIELSERLVVLSDEEEFKGLGVNSYYPPEGYGLFTGLNGGENFIIGKTDPIGFPDYILYPIDITGGCGESKEDLLSTTEYFGGYNYQLHESLENDISNLYDATRGGALINDQGNGFLLYATYPGGKVNQIKGYNGWELVDGKIRPINPDSPVFEDLISVDKCSNGIDFLIYEP